MATVSAKADVVVAQFNGSASTIDLWNQPLPGPGVYKFDLTSSSPVTFDIAAGYTYHWDVFVAPPPKPHSEFLEGNTADIMDGVSGVDTNATWTFVAPETNYVFFSAPAYYDVYGVPEGTPVYEEQKHENPYFSIFASRDDQAAFDYVFTVSRVAPVPEPATWALMILGFGAVGMAIRRRTAALSRAA